MTTISNTTCFPPGKLPQTDLSVTSRDEPLDHSLTFYSDANGTTHRIPPSEDGPLTYQTPLSVMENALDFDMEKSIASMAEVAYDTTTWAELFAIGWLQTVYCSFLGSCILRMVHPPKFRNGKVRLSRKEWKTIHIPTIGATLLLLNIWFSWVTFEKVVWLSFRSSKDARRWAALALEMSAFSSAGSAMAWFGDGSRKIVYSYGAG